MDFKIHDIVKIEQQSTDPARYWDHSQIVGVVVELGNQIIGVVMPDGEHEKFDLTPEKYTTTITEYSEIAYKQDIENVVRRTQDTIKENNEKLIRAVEWKEKFENQVSFFGRLVRFLKSEKRIIN